MARKGSKRKARPVEETTRTFPELHDKIAAALEGTDLKPAWVERDNDSLSDHDEEYSSNVMGRFRCINQSCRTGGWGSKLVAIVIRGYDDCSGYNAEVFNQRCRACEQLGTLTLDEASYVERVVYRLKKWGGVEVERPFFGGQDGRPPHEQDLCEGCQAGYCQRGA